jgi:hypothetical protein
LRVTEAAGAGAQNAPGARVQDAPVGSWRDIIKDVVGMRRIAGYPGHGRELVKLQEIANRGHRSKLQRCLQGGFECTLARWSVTKDFLRKSRAGRERNPESGQALRYADQPHAEGVNLTGI